MTALADQNRSWTPRLGAALFLVAAGLPAGAAEVVIDDFADPQAVSSGRGAASQVDASAGVILGGERDLEVELLTGAGTLTADANTTASGALSFAVAEGDRGRLFAIWDGDDDSSAVSASGLGGIDLTDAAGGVPNAALRLTVEAVVGQVEILAEVFTDAGNSSRAAAVATGPGELLLTFGGNHPDFSTHLGSGADFTDVGAIVLELRSTGAVGTGSSIDVAEIRTVPPGLAEPALKVDLDPVTESDLVSARPGDTIRYRITLTNTGSEVVGIDLADTVDPNTSTVPGSLNTTPIAFDDHYTTFGNVQLDVALAAAGLLRNDTDPDENVATSGSLTVSAFDSSSLQSATSNVNVGADGTFTYDAPPSFQGVDSFTYTVTDDEGDTATATVTVVVDGVVWFVDNSSCSPSPCGVGTQSDPFSTLKQAEAASAPNDVIRVRQGDGTDSGHDAGLILKDGQHLVGGAADLTIAGTLIEPATGASVHSHGLGHVIELASNNTVEGLVANPSAATFHAIRGNGSSAAVLDNVTIRPALGGGGLSLINHSGGFTFSNSSIASASPTTGVAVEISGGAGSFDFSNGSSIQHQGGGLLDISNSAGATFDFSASGLSLNAGTADGIDLQNNAGAVFTFDSIGDLATSSGHGIRIANSGTVKLNTVGNVSAVGGAALDVGGSTVVKIGTPGPVTFASLSATTSPAFGISLSGVATATTVTGSTSLTDTAMGVRLESSGDATFGAELSVTTTSGPGLVASTTGTVTVSAASSSIDATGGAAVDFTSTPMAMTFASLSSATSTGSGVNLVGTTGTLNANGGEITGAVGTAFNVSGGSPVVSYAGDVNQNGAQRVVDLENTTGGSVSFTGGTVSGGAASLGVRIHNVDGNASFADLNLGTDLNRLTSTAVSLTGGSSGTLSFADTQIFTDGAAGVDANNGGTVEVTGGGNRVTTSSGIAIRMVGGTTLGANGVTFARVDASGSSHGIELAGTGSTGFFEVTGDGASDPADTTAGRTTSAMGGGVLALGSGGTITGVEDAVRLTSTTDVRLRNMVLGDASASRNDAVSGAADITDNGIEITNGTGLTLDNVILSRTGDHGIQGFGINSDLTLRHSEILNAGDNGAGPTNGDDAIDFRTGIGGPPGPHSLIGSALIESSVLAGMSDSGMEVENFSGVLDLTVRHSFIGNNHHTDAACAPCEGDGFLLRADGGSATINMVVQDTSFNDVANDGIDLGNDQATNLTTLIAERITASNNSEADNLIDTANTSGTLRARITDLTSDASHRGTVLFFKADGAATTDVTIDTSGSTPNTILGSALGRAIEVFIDGDPGSGSVDGSARVSIRNTDISNTFDAGVFLLVQDMLTAGGSLDVTVDDVTLAQPTRTDNVIVGSLEAVAGGGGNGTLRLNLVASTLGLGSTFFGTPLEGLVFRGDRDIEVACNDDGNGGNGTPCTSIGILTGDDSLLAGVMNEGGNQIDDGGLRPFAASDVFTSAALRMSSGEVRLVAPGAVALPTPP